MAPSAVLLRDFDDERRAWRLDPGAGRVSRAEPLGRRTLFIAKVLRPPGEFYAAYADTAHAYLQIGRERWVLDDAGVCVRLRNVGPIRRFAIQVDGRTVYSKTYLKPIVQSYARLDPFFDEWDDLSTDFFLAVYTSIGNGTWLDRLREEAQRSGPG